MPSCTVCKQPGRTFSGASQGQTGPREDDIPFVSFRSNSFGAAFLTASSLNSCLILAFHFLQSALNTVVSLAELLLVLLEFLQCPFSSQVEHVAFHFTSLWLVFMCPYSPQILQDTTAFLEGSSSIFLAFFIVVGVC
eukprot:Lithocolla_globosa_v1_NODE_1881_length_2277_cov_195.480648.p3 type:complete len:137 gc:universal NODE_1881_length_2277_cov_195.480648:1831-2241(+)